MRKSCVLLHKVRYVCYINVFVCIYMNVFACPLVLVSLAATLASFFARQRCKFADRGG